ncbi:MAG: hypothetical protein HYV54_01560 [Parcubacteria group bacterium]|nr:hypothetical protein [Parcubacteria group bacterium]
MNNTPVSEKGTSLDERANRAANNWWNTLPPDRQNGIKREHFEKEVPRGEWREWVDGVPQRRRD